MKYSLEEAKYFCKENFIFDFHGHKDKFIPKSIRLLNLKHFPKDISAQDMLQTGVNGFIICALGDPNTFSVHKVDSYVSVLKQIEEIKNWIAKAGGVIAKSEEEIFQANSEGKPVFVLGIEGGDFLEGEIYRLDNIYQIGVRVLLPFHYSNNCLGSVCMGWGGKIIPESENIGLSQFGEKVIKRAQELGIFIDLAHASEKAIFKTANISKFPIICSHTGPRFLQDFPRYISKEAIKAIADTGGIVGMWAFYNKGKGVKDLLVFVDYIKYVADLVGVEYIGIGTDINGVPQNTNGYKNLFDYHKIAYHLLNSGFIKEEVKKIMGDNFLNLLNNI